MKEIEIGSVVYVKNESVGTVVGREEYGPETYCYIVDLHCGGTVHADEQDVEVERPVLAPGEIGFKILNKSIAEATKTCRMPTLPNNQWLFIDIYKGDQFYIVSKDEGVMVLSGRQHGDIVSFSTYAWENGRIDELSKIAGRDVYFENEAFLDGETVTIVGCAVMGRYNYEPMAELADGRIVDPKDLAVRPTVLGDLATVDCGL